jgi:copper chaperone NosL
MSYQPPLIGSKKLLNFTAYSFPDIGGLAAFGSLLGGTAIFAAEGISERKRRAPTHAMAQTQ